MGNRVVAVLARDVGPFLARVSSIPLRLFFGPLFNERRSPINY